MRLAYATALSLVVAGCSLLVDTKGLTTSAANEGLDEASLTDARPEAGDGAANGCAGNEGPAMVRITEGACIDSTEVTRGHYDKFLASVGSGPLPGLPAACSFKTSHQPAPAAAPSSTPDRAMSAVDWCDALAYCTWAGKRLCGTLTGGSVPASQAGDPQHDLWYRACSNNGASVYPWGNDVFDGSRCNGPSAGRAAVADVKSFPGCTGGIAGLFDMAGNVQEWEDSCDGTLASSSCADRGGAFVHHDTTPEDVRLQCGHRDAKARNTQADNNGIRCCSY